MFRKNITLRLTFGFLTIVILSTLLTGIFALNIFKTNIYQVKINNLKKHSKEILKEIDADLLNNITGADSDYFKKISKSFPNLKIWIIDSKKQIIALEKNRESGVSFINDSEINNIYTDLIEKSLSGAEVYNDLYNPYYDEYMMSIGMPVKNNNGHIIGAIILHSSIADITNSMDKFFIYLLYALLCEAIFAGFLGYYFSKNISKPIRILNTSALEMARGKYGIQTNIFQNDEIGELSNSFDLLSLKLKHTISQLLEEKNKLTSIISSMNEGILALDKDLNLINANESALNLLSIEDDSKIIATLKELHLIDELKFSLNENEKRTIIKKFQDKILNFSISPISQNTAKATGAVLLIQDVSEAEKLEQLRRNFISNVSHEFRTPLTVMKGNLELLKDGMVAPEDINDSYLTLLRETDRLERMVKDLLDLSKLESGKVDLVLNEVDINMLINDTVRSLKPMFNRKNIKLQILSEKSLPPLLTDYDKLKQLLIIFIDNAVKFSPEKSTIDISTSIKDNYLCIAIKDEGIGIPKDEIQYLGERFYKADKSRSSYTDGTGLGISIAKQLVKLLNGNLKIESTLGKGTTILIYLEL